METEQLAETAVASVARAARMRGGERKIPSVLRPLHQNARDRGPECVVNLSLKALLHGAKEINGSGVWSHVPEGSASHNDCGLNVHSTQWLTSSYARTSRRVNTL
jgi:hypothetical protein